MNEPAVGWQPQPRPPWVTKLNLIGENRGSPANFIALDEASVLEAAQDATGLSDFGGDEWREPFGLLVSDLDEVAELTLAGRIMARSELIRSLMVRLEMAEVERQHPEILEQLVEQPIFITGMGRTGTSILFELLAEDPALRAPMAWELRYPSPPPQRATRDTDPRIAKAAADTGMWTEITPEFLAIHETHPDGPDEDSSGQIHEFASPVWTATHRVPNYEAWLQGSGMTQAFRFHRRLLQHLQWRDPGQWILKAPAHLSCLPSLFAEYPDARVIHTHRDPLKVLASTANMLATLRWQRSDRVDHEEIAQTIGFGYPVLLDMVIEQRDSGEVPGDRFVDVRFADLMADHLATIRTLYGKLGLELSEEAASRMAHYIESRPKGRHGVASYRFEHMGIDLESTREMFAGYMARFDVPEEEL
ncbi:MAG: hypothetical protein ACI9C1_001355 [Candidatus Aldehydirespiratoraceae bacterium]|jgi:hypothetical protein